MTSKIQPPILTLKMGKDEVLLLPATFIGMFIGLSVNDARHQPGTSMTFQDPAFIRGIAILLIIYLILTIGVFRIRKNTFEFNYRQFRALWVGAFLLGALLTPVIYELAIRDK